MKLRTEIEPLRKLGWIEPSTPVTLLGSCFSDNIGQLLERDGFDCIHNPLGPLFNPASIANAVSLAAAGKRMQPEMLTEGPRGLHCMDFASRFSGADGEEICRAVNTGVGLLGTRLADPHPHVLVLTLGSAFVYLLDGERIVGNCHKFPASRFERRRLSIEEVVNSLSAAIGLLPASTFIVLTVSPVRHLDDGLHGNTLSKAVLHLAAEELAKGENIVYFPAFEILTDDLRDYRFYADDLKHPSTMACEYIYEHFCSTFLTPEARQHAVGCRKAKALANHRPLFPD